MRADRRPSERFGDRAVDYAAFRPGYPDAAIDAVLAGLGAPAGLTAADIGAGTGISARAIADRGALVVALEPNAAMRAAAQPHARVTWQSGTGEATGLQDRSVDLTCAFQSFHWFATESSMREMHRVARRRAVLVQNERDERDAFTRAFGDVVRACAIDDTEVLRLRALDMFAAFPDATTERSSFVQAQRVNVRGLIGRAESASYLPKSGPAATAMRDEIRNVFERFARGATQLDLALTTHLIRADW